MTILKTAGISLGILAIVGGGSLAVISASAQGRMFDSSAISFIQNGDLAGYKNYLIGQETTRINAIDQTKFDKIKANYTAQKPLLDLQAKYEAQLITLATNKDQVGFVTLFKQFQTQAKPLMDAQRAAHDAQEATKSGSSASSSTEINNRSLRGNRGTIPTLTDAQLTDMANRTYTRAVADIAAGKTFKLGFGGGKGHKGGMKDSMHHDNNQVSSISSVS